MSATPDNLKITIDAAVEMVRQYRPIHLLGAQSTDTRLQLDTVYVDVYMKNAQDLKKLGQMIEDTAELKGRTYIALGRWSYPSVQRLIIFFKNPTFQETGTGVVYGPPLKKRKAQSEK